MNAGTVAQDALDIYSVRFGVDRAISSALDDHIVWWKKKGKRTLRITKAISSRSRMHVKATVLNPDGTIQQDPPINTELNPAFRYFRFSQVTNDLTDAYRNMYLAFESMLTGTFGGPQPDKSTGRLETETMWLKRVLGELDNVIPLQAYVLQGVSDPITTFFNDQYEANRCALFHAKLGKRAILPGSFAERAKVATALRQLGSLVAHMLRTFLCTKRSFSGKSLYAMTQEVHNLTAQGFTLGVNEDDTPFDPMASVISPKGLPVVDFGTSYQGVTDGIGFEHAFFGTIDAHHIGTMSIQCLVGHVATVPYVHDSVPSLVVTGMDIVETKFLYRMHNHGDLKDNHLL